MRARTAPTAHETALTLRRPERAARTRPSLGAKSPHLIFDRYGKWRSWIAGELFGGAPGAIDNSSLLDSDKVGLRPGLVESTDFHVIPETVWNKFEGTVRTLLLLPPSKR